MASLARIRVHPIKSLDPVEREAVRISGDGGLAGDRAYAVVDDEGAYVNGKRTAAVHRLRTRVDLEAGAVEVGVAESPAPGGPGSGRGVRRFDLDDDREALSAWLSEHFGLAVSVVSADGGGLTDGRVYGDGPPGVTVVSTATLREVASWFPGVDVDGVRDRFRTNLEVDGVEPFWEDRLVARGRRRFRIGEVGFEALKPVGRCVVPTRDPTTGEATEGFRERFIERRTETLPADAEPDVFDHPNVLTVLADPAEEDRGKTIHLGDEVDVPD